MNLCANQLVLYSRSFFYAQHISNNFIPIAATVVILITSQKFLPNSYKCTLRLWFQAGQDHGVHVLFTLPVHTNNGAQGLPSCLCPPLWLPWVAGLSHSLGGIDSLLPFWLYVLSTIIATLSQSSRTLVQSLFFKYILTFVVHVFLKFRYPVQLFWIQTYDLYFSDKIFSEVFSVSPTIYRCPFILLKDNLEK